MKAKDLRLGNIVRNKEGKAEFVYTLNVDGVINGYDGNAGIIPDDEKLFEGIQFDDDWAVLFGYECSQELAVCIHDGDLISVNKLNEMKVHEVQNLFFGLYKEDLEYKIKDLHKMNLNRD